MNLQPANVPPSMRLPLPVLHASVKFHLNGEPWVQLGNAEKCCVCLMPAKTPEDFEMINHMRKAWAEYQEE